MKKALLGLILLGLVFTSTIYGAVLGGAGSGSGDFLADGSVPMTGDLEMGTNSIDGDSSAGLSFDPDNDDNNEVVFTATGNVGIGTVSPTSLLEVFQSANTVGIRTHSPDGSVATDTVDMYHDQSDGNVKAGGGDLILEPGADGNEIIIDGIPIKSISAVDTNGINNIFIGTNSGNANTTGDSNIFMGSTSGDLNTEGSFNVFIGQATGTANTTGNSNFFMGDAAGEANVTSSANVYIGQSAGKANLTGNNVMIGKQAGWVATDASDNVFLGTSAGFDITTGDRNVLIGFSAGVNQTDAQGNTIIGWFAGQNETTGAGNTYMGYQTSTFNKTGVNNTKIGYQSGYGVNNNDHSNNTFIGYFSGRNVSTGSNNTSIGLSACEDISSGDGNVCIGHMAGEGNLTTQSNRLYIDNSDTATPLIYGEFDNDIITINGNLGIGTTVPLAILEIIEAGTTPFMISNGAGGAGDFVIVDTAGNVGIGIISPGVALEVVGTVETDALTLGDDEPINFGIGTDAILQWDSAQGKDSLQLGINVGSDAATGIFSIMEDTDIGHANRDPEGASSEPMLRIYSSDETQQNDFISIHHDKTDGKIICKNGDLELDVNQQIWFNSGFGTWLFNKGATTMLDFRTDTTTDEAKWGLTDAAGNQLIVVNSGVVHLNYDHPVQTNPTLFINSDLSPDISNNQWGSFAHDQEDFVITTGVNVGTGSGATTDDNAIRFKPRGVDQMIIKGAGNVGIGTTIPIATLEVNGLIVPDLLTSDPCTASNAGAIFYNSTANELCFCDGTNDLRVKDASTACF